MNYSVSLSNYFQICFFTLLTDFLFIAYYSSKQANNVELWIICYIFAFIHVLTILEFNKIFCLLFFQCYTFNKERNWLKSIFKNIEWDVVMFSKFVGPILRCNKKWELGLWLKRKLHSSEINCTFSRFNYHMTKFCYAYMVL